MILATNYTRGRYSEYRAKTHLEKEGYFWVTRSPASKGRFDLTGVGYGGSILLQVKRTRRKKLVPSMYKAEMEEIQKWVDSLEFLPINVRVELWVMRDGIKGWTKFRFKPKQPYEIYEGAEGMVTRK